MHFALIIHLDINHAKEISQDLGTIFPQTCKDL